MKKALLLLSICVGLIYSSQAFYVVRVVGNTFSPATTTMNVGDTVVFVIPAGHTVTQVSQATWNANGTTPVVGGFDETGPDTVGYIFNSAGTAYFVCKNHAAMGMKGTLIVNTPTGIPKTFSENAIRTYPSLVTDQLHIEAPKISSLRLSIYNTKGELVLNRENLSEIENIYVGNLAGGMYIGILTDKERSHTWKFLKK